MKTLEGNQMAKTETFQSLFPNLTIQAKEKTPEELFENFLKNFPEFQLEDDEAIAEGDDWTMIVRFDKNAELETVFQSEFTVYCPTTRVFGEYCETPEDALKSLSFLLKENDEDTEDSLEDLEDLDLEDEFVLEKTKESILAAISKEIGFNSILYVKEDARIGRKTLVEKDTRIRVMFDTNEKRTFFKIMARGEKWVEVSTRNLEIILNRATVKKVELS